MFNVEEQPDHNDSKSYDADVALEILNSAGVDQCEGEFSTERTGSPDKEKNRPLKIKFDYLSPQRLICYQC